MMNLVTLLKQKFINWVLNKNSRLLVPLFLSALPTLAQVAPDKYYIQFKDKNNSPYSINDPLQFLSQRAIDRRIHHSVTITKQDFPVNPQYVQTLIQTVNCDVLLRLRWMNGVVIRTNDTIGLQSVLSLPFVDSINSRRVVANTLIASDKFKTTSKPYKFEKYKTVNTLIDYGASRNQNTMIGVDAIHDMGFTGVNMRIAVIDAGFRGALTSNCLSHLWNSNKVIAEWDFVTDSPLDYTQYSNHGTNVLKCMGANLPGEYVGSAPDAEYILIRTEDAPTENPIEEYNWVAGAEYADSAGADVFNTSLGYTTFDNPVYNHTYTDLDGNTTVITRAADIAASKGILVVNSAGNSGNDQWRYIGAPADGDSVLAVGAVDANSNVVGFSSRGPSVDGRVKPNVMAMGAGVPVPDDNGGFNYINGTSFSGPILAGAAACLWEARSSYTNMEVFNAIQESAHLYLNPNNDFGYGIPNMNMAYYYVTNVNNLKAESYQLLYPNPANKQVRIAIEAVPISEVAIYNQLGQLVIKPTVVDFQIDVSNLINGIYLVVIETEEKRFNSKLIICD